MGYRMEKWIKDFGINCEIFKNEDILRKNKIKTIKLYGNQKRIKKLCEILHFNDRCKYINYGEEADFNKKDIYEYIEIK